MLVPDLVWTAVAAPPVMPCAASKLLVEMLTFSMVSTGAMYPAWCGSHTLMLAAPSIRVTLLLRFVPLMLVLSARPGVSVCAFWNTGGVAPGTRFISV